MEEDEEEQEYHDDEDEYNEEEEEEEEAVDEKMDELLLKFSSMPNLVDEVFLDGDELFRSHHQAGARSKRSSISSKSVAFSNYDDTSSTRRGSITSENVKFESRGLRGNDTTHDKAELADREKKIHE